jgi:D-alanyl-D-alanine carboxypeptidase
VEHGGGINGFNAYVLRAPEQHLYVAVLTNASPPRTSPQEVAVQLAAQVLRVSLDAAETPLGPHALDEYSGSYSLDHAQVRRISREAGRLYAQDGDASRAELVPIGKDLFEVRADRTRFRFQRERGRVVAVEREPRILMGDRAVRADAAE